MVENLVALALVALGILLVTSSSLQQSRSAQRLRAADTATRAVEAAVETLRAAPGQSLESGVLAPGVAYPAVPGNLDLRLVLDVATTELPDLFEITIEARYVVLGQPRSRTVHTLLWRPR